MNQSFFHEPQPRDDAVTMFDAMKKIKSAVKEHLYVFKGKRQILRFEGSHDRVTPSSEYHFQFKNTTVIHNHPGGTSFSKEDVKSAFALEIRRFILVTENFIFTLTGLNQNGHIKANQFDHRFDTCKQIAEQMADKLISQNELRLIEKDQIVIHYIWLLFFHNSPIVYAKKEWEDFVV